MRRTKRSGSVRSRQCCALKKPYTIRLRCAVGQVGRSRYTVNISRGTSPWRARGANRIFECSARTIRLKSTSFIMRRKLMATPPMSRLAGECGAREQSGGRGSVSVMQSLRTQLDRAGTVRSGCPKGAKAVAQGSRGLGEKPTPRGDSAETPRGSRGAANGASQAGRMGGGAGDISTRHAARPMEEKMRSGRSSGPTSNLSD